MLQTHTKNKRLSQVDFRHPRKVQRLMLLNPIFRHHEIPGIRLFLCSVSQRVWHCQPVNIFMVFSASQCVSNLHLRSSADFFFMHASSHPTTEVGHEVDLKIGLQRVVC